MQYLKDLLSGPIILALKVWPLHQQLHLGRESEMQSLKPHPKHAESEFAL